MLVDVGAGLRALLLSSPSIVAMVGERVFATQLLQGEIRDSIVYNPISEIETYHYRGPSFLMSTRFQIDSWSRSRDSAEALGNRDQQVFGFGIQRVNALAIEAGAREPLA